MQRYLLESRSILNANFCAQRTGCPWRYRRTSKDYQRNVQTSEALIELAMIRLLVACLRWRTP